MVNIPDAGGDAARSSRRGFICAGCWTLDRVKLIDAWPQEESLAMIGEIDRQGGGSAHNVGIGLKRIDASLPVEGIGLLGHDADGDFLYARAREYGIDTRQMHRTDKVANSFTDVMTVQGSGRRTFFHHTGTNDLLTPGHFDFEGTSARCMHLGLLGVHAILDQAWEESANGWVAILASAQAAGLETSIELVSIDPRRIRELALPCLPLVNRLIVNDQEIGALSGVETIVDGRAVPERCLEAARAVRNIGDAMLVAVHYPGGAVAVDADGICHQSESRNLAPDQIVGSVGAGDAFAAGTLYALHEGWSVERALALGHAVAASSLRSATAVESIGTLDECLAASVVLNGH